MVIFDFDLTMVNTQPVEALRANRNWSGVMARVSDLEVYDGINELLSELHARKQVIAIVTKSPDMVPKAFARHHNWPIDIVIGYHQVQRRKPDPEGLLLAMTKGQSDPSSTVHVGDSAEDTAASRAAGVTAIGAGWGLSDTSTLSASKPDYLFTSVSDLRRMLFRER
jgi:phosphoglycolate phosphatase-like HAD superfamily hydrolase